MGRAHYKPIIEYCGGTEIGGSFISGSLLQAQSLAAFSTPVMGCSLFILGDDGYPIVSTIQLLTGRSIFSCHNYSLCSEDWTRPLTIEPGVDSRFSFDR